METILGGVLFLALSGSVTGNIQTADSQKFQAGSFLDMLGRSFDPKVAYADLFTELNRRMSLDSANLTSVSGVQSLNGNKNQSTCPEAPRMRGSTVTYTSSSHLVGSRAFYQCETGYDGTSKFIYCTQDGSWSSLAEWQGCSPVDCGIIPPNVQNSDSSFTTTTFGSIVTYSCDPGYKLDGPTSSLTCLDTGLWETPSFSCLKANQPPLQKIQQLQQLATTLIGAGPSSSSNNKSPAPAPIQAPAAPNQMMEAFLKSYQAYQSVTNQGSGNHGSSAASVNPMAFFSQMFASMSSPTPAPTTTTSTTPAPTMKSPFGLQLPSHIQNLIGGGIPNVAGIKPQDLLTLTSMGLGSANPAAAPRDITQLLGSMNPLSMFGGGMGLGIGGLGARGGAVDATATAAPMEPEKVAEQRQDMLMRAMMANAMKSMMGGGGGSNNGTAAANKNPAMDIMTLMALQSSLGGGASGAGGGGGSGNSDPFAMLFPGFGNLFGGAA